jgi:hypothetical protein
VVGAQLIPTLGFALGALAPSGASWGIYALAGGAAVLIAAGVLVLALRKRRARAELGEKSAPAGPLRTAEARILVLRLEGDEGDGVATRAEAALIRRLSGGASVAAGAAPPLKPGRALEDDLRRLRALAGKARAGLLVWGAVEGGVARLRLCAAGGAPEAYSLPADLAPPFDAALAALAGAAALDSGGFPGLAAPLGSVAEEIADTLRDARPVAAADAARLRAGLARAALALDAAGGYDTALDAALAATAEADPRAETEPLEWAEAQALRATALARAAAGLAEPPLSDVDACADAWRAAYEVWTALGAEARAARDEPARLAALLEAADRDGDRRGLEEVERLAAEALARREIGAREGELTAILGGARLRLGEREPRTVRLEAAERDLRRALVLAEQARNALRAAVIKDELARALARLGERDRGTERLRAAAVIFRFGLEDGSRTELARSRSRAALGRTLVHVGERDRDVGAVDEAVRALRMAANGLASNGAPNAAAQARRALERAERLYAELRAARASAVAET